MSKWKGVLEDTVGRFRGVLLFILSRQLRLEALPIMKCVTQRGNLKQLPAQPRKKIKSRFALKVK